MKPTTFYNRKCIVCNDIPAILARVGAITLCEHPCYSTNFTTDDPIAREWPKYLKLLNKHLAQEARQD